MPQEGGRGFGISYIVGVDLIIYKGASDTFPFDLVVPFIDKDVNKDCRRQSRGCYQGVQQLVWCQSCSVLGAIN